GRLGVVRGDEMVTRVDEVSVVLDRGALRVHLEVAGGYPIEASTGVGHAALRASVAVRSWGAVEVDEDGTPVEVLPRAFHVVPVFDRLPEHPRIRLQLTQITLDALGHTQAVRHRHRVESAGPAAAHLAHPQGLVGTLGDV